MQLLVARGADVHARTDPPANATAIHYAEGCPDIEEFLLSRGAKSVEYQHMERLISIFEDMIVPDSKLPADPEERQQVLERNSSLQSSIADMRSALESEECSCDDMPSSDEEPGGSGSTSSDEA